MNERKATINKKPKKMVTLDELPTHEMDDFFEYKCQEFKRCLKTDSLLVRLMMMMKKWPKFLVSGQRKNNV